MRKSSLEAGRAKPPKPASRRNTGALSRETRLPPWSQPQRDRGGSDVLANLRQMILNAKYEPGSKLPSEREIAIRLGVGRPAVREAIKALCMLEVLDSRRGAGTFVRSLSALTEDWPLQLKPSQLEFDMIELLEVRRMIEPPAAALAAARATPAQLLEMRRSLEIQEAEIEDVPVVNDQDYLFHDAIIRAAGNQVLLDLSRVLAPLLIKSRKITGSSAPDFGGMLRMHKLIYEAIRMSDPETARRLMLDHLHLVGMDLLARPQPGRT